MKPWESKLVALCLVHVHVQFVNFTEIMSKNTGPDEKEAAFALATLMEIPLQYKAVMELGILGSVIYIYIYAKLFSFLYDL